MESKKEIGVAYGLAIAGYFTPAAGLHRFYLNRPFTGVLWLLTWGLFGVGTLIDLIRMQTMVDQENVAAGYLPVGRNSKLLTAEQQILRIAESEDGVVTVPMIAARTGLTLRRAETELDRMFDDGHVTLDVNEEGAKLYIFTGLRSKKPLMLDDGIG